MAWRNGVRNSGVSGVGGERRGRKGGGWRSNKRRDRSSKRCCRDVGELRGGGGREKRRGRRRRKRERESFACKQSVHGGAVHVGNNQEFQEQWGE